jgi:hypothetical protein
MFEQTANIAISGDNVANRYDLLGGYILQNCFARAGTLLLDKPQDCCQPCEPICLLSKPLLLFDLAKHQHAPKSIGADALIECWSDPVEEGEAQVLQGEDAMQAWKLAGGREAVSRVGVDSNEAEQPQFVVIAMGLD